MPGLPPPLHPPPSSTRPQAEECRLVAEHLGCFAFKMEGFVVSSLHRLLSSLEALRAADVVRACVLRACVRATCLCVGVRGCGPVCEGGVVGGWGGGWGICMSLLISF